MLTRNEENEKIKSMSLLRLLLIITILYYAKKWQHIYTQTYCMVIGQ